MLRIQRAMLLRLTLAKKALRLRKTIQPDERALELDITVLILGQGIALGTGAAVFGEHMSKHHKLCKEDYRKIWRDSNGEIPSGYHIHHIDGNPYNNDISNLQCISPEEHADIHRSEFIKWATEGGKLGGIKCREEKLGWFALDEEARKKRSDHARTFIRTELFSEMRKQEYESGTRKHWTTFYSPEEVSKKISAGDPGKSTRGKKAWNSGSKMTLSNPELAKENKRNAALKREKVICGCCQKYFDAGNLKRHQASSKYKETT